MIRGDWLADALQGHLAGKTVKALLVTSAHVDAVAQQTRADITAELVATGYTAGGVAVSGVSATFDSVANAVMLTCSTISFGAVVTEDVAGVVLYVDTGTAANDELLVSDIAPPIVAEGGDLTYTPAPSGLILIGID